MSQRSFSIPLLLALLAVVYFAAARLGLLLAIVNPSASAVWAPTGIALAAGLLLGYRVWPSILLGAFLANVTNSGSVPTSIAIAVGNTLEGLLGAYLVNRFAGGCDAFRRAKDIFKFALLAGLVSTAVSATFGVTSLALTGLAAWADYGPIWLTWWLGDATGAFLVAPLIILWATPPRVAWNRRQAFEAAALLLALITLSLVVFSGLSPFRADRYPLNFAVLPVVVWAAFRFGQRGAATTTAILATISVWGTLNGFGPFAREGPNQALLLLQAFNGIIAITGLGLAAVVAERRQVEETLRLSRDQLAVILQGAADGIMAQDFAGRPRYANDAAARLIGYASTDALLEAPPGELLRKLALYDESGRPFPADRLPGSLALQGLPHASATIRYRNLATGEEYWSADQATPIFGADGRVQMVINIWHDITELKRAELKHRLLAEAGQLLAASLDADARLASLAQLVVPHLADWCAVHVLEDDQTIRLVRAAPADWAHSAPAAAVPQRDPPAWDPPEALARVLRTREALLIPKLTGAMLPASSADGEDTPNPRRSSPASAMVVPLLARDRTLGAMTFVWAESGRHYNLADLALAEELARQAALAADNAWLYQQAQSLNAELEDRVRQRTLALERSQAEARALSSRLLKAREEERTQIAREIHDELGQQLTGLKMDLAQVSKAVNLGDTAEPHARITVMSELLDDTIWAVRRLATSLRPSLLDDFGLLAAVEWQLQELEKRTGITCRLNSSLDNLDLKLESATALFRVCQEALTNVVRHAQATEVEVAVEIDDGRLRLQIRDNGRGIADQSLKKTSSLGLVGMRERVRLINGQLDIQGSSGKGTTVSVVVPLLHNQPGALDTESNVAPGG